MKLSDNHICGGPNSRGQESFVHVCTDLSYHSLVLFKMYLLESKALYFQAYQVSEKLRCSY